MWELCFDFDAFALDEEVVGVAGTFGDEGGLFALFLVFSGFSLLGGGFIIFVIGEAGLFEGQGGVIDGVVVCFMVVVVGEEL